MRKIAVSDPVKKASDRPAASTRCRSITVVLVAGLFASMPTYAYIDPGTGSFILQGLLASIAVAFGLARTYWERIKAFFGSQDSAKDFDPQVLDAVDEDADAQRKT